MPLPSLHLKVTYLLVIYSRVCFKRLAVVYTVTLLWTPFYILDRPVDTSSFVESFKLNRYCFSDFKYMIVFFTSRIKFILSVIPCRAAHIQLQSLKITTGFPNLS